MAIFTITTNAQENQPPLQTGDIYITLDNAELYTFTSADFSTGTTPVYVDPEGDALYSIELLSLPTTGELLLDGSSVVLNEEDSFSVDFALQGVQGAEGPPGADRVVPGPEGPEGLEGRGRGLGCRLGCRLGVPGGEDERHEGGEGAAHRLGGGRRRSRGRAPIRKVRAKVKVQTRRL